MKRKWFAGLTLVLGITATTADAQTNDAVLPPGRGSRAVLSAPVPEGENGAVLLQGDKGPAPVTRVTTEPANRASIYGSAEYLLWWIRKSNNPALVTSGDPADTPTGALGQPGTRVLFGDDRTGPGAMSGGRFTLGVWLGNDQAWALEGTFLFLAQRSRNFGFTGTGDAGTGSLNIPFLNADTGLEDAFQIALPGNQSGSINVRSAHRLEGAEVNLRTILSETACARVSFIGGFRYFGLHESLGMENRADFFPLAIGVNTFFTDSFGTRNQFYGGQVGLDTEFVRGNWVVNVKGKVALGSVNQTVSVSGLTTNTDPINGVVTTPGGLFTAPSNLGDHGRSVFAVVPELGVTVGYQLNQNWTATLGYTFIYVSSVVRPGDQMDRGINFTPPGAGPTRPAFGFNSSDFWTQGVSVGLQYRY